MRKIRSEIEQYRTALTNEGGVLTSRYLFPSGFIGFQGHFPTKMVLPGVCHIQCALSLVENGIGKPLALKEIVLAKYFSPVFPDEEVTCVVSDIAEGSDEFTMRALLTKGSAKVAELKLRVVAGAGSTSH